MNAKIDPRLAIVVPTRNRAEMAARSIDSALRSPSGDHLRIIVSDNSTDASERLALEKYLAGADRRVRSVRPSEPLGMTAHWNFALEEALSEKANTHFLFLTDRMLFRHTAINRILNILRAFPDDVLSFTYDRLLDVELPILFRKLPRSGDLIRIDSDRLLGMAAAMSFPSCLPRMLNSISPRAHIENIVGVYSSVFSSISPDFNFCYKTLALKDSIVYCDDSLLINYSQARSNGASFARGVTSRDSKDFLANLTDPINAQTPIPAILTVGNAIVHEYLSVKSLSISRHFPDVVREKYLDLLAAEVLRFHDAGNKERARALLVDNGWRPTARFQFRRWSSTLTEWALNLASRKFASIDEAIAGATIHQGGRAAWFPHPARRYGKPIDVPSTIIEENQI